MDKQQFLDLVNEDIERLYAAAIQYNNHAAMIEGAPWMGYADDLRGHAHDDFSQAQDLSDKVQYYGGIPSVKVHQITLSPDTRTMVEADLAIQKESVQRYRERAQQARSLSMEAMVPVYHRMIEHEEEHHNTTESFLGAKTEPTPPYSYEVSPQGAPPAPAGQVVLGDPEQAELEQFRMARAERASKYASRG